MNSALWAISVRATVEAAPIARCRTHDARPNYSGGVLELAGDY